MKNNGTIKFTGNKPIKFTRGRIRNMCIVLEKLYNKLPVEQAKYIIAEASDLPGILGYFEATEDCDVIFKYF